MEGRSLFTKWTSKELDALLAIDEVEVQTVEELEEIWPATKGHALLHAGGMIPHVPLEGTIALPSEVSFAATGASFPPELAFTDDKELARRLDATGKPAPIPESHLNLVPWEEARKRFGAVLVFDATAPTRVSVLSTAQPFDLCRQQAAFFLRPTRRTEANLSKRSTPT
jgi:hypothetical protein